MLCNNVPNSAICKGWHVTYICKTRIILRVEICVNKSSRPIPFNWCACAKTVDWAFMYWFYIRATIPVIFSRFINFGNNYIVDIYILFVGQWLGWTSKVTSRQILQENFEDTKVVISSRKSKVRQNNDRMIYKSLHIKLLRDRGTRTALSSGMLRKGIWVSIYMLQWPSLILDLSILVQKNSLTISTWFFFHFKWKIFKTAANQNVWFLRYSHHMTYWRKITKWI